MTVQCTKQDGKKSPVEQTSNAGLKEGGSRKVIIDCPHRIPEKKGDGKK